MKSLLLVGLAKEVLPGSSVTVCPGLEGLAGCWDSVGWAMDRQGEPLGREW